MEAEQWRTIEGHEEYLVSNLGRVKNISSKGRFKKLTNDGEYLHVRLSKHGVAKTIRVHRLVAKAFIPNPDEKFCVDHIDRNKLNNVVSNLRWVTHSENNLNTEIRADNTSGFKGVSKTRGNRWNAFASEDGKTIWLGSFATKEEAAEAYRLYHTQ